MARPFKLIFNRINGVPEILEFREISSDHEINNVFKFRYIHYLRRGYISPNHKRVDTDTYDNGQSRYFIALFKNEIVGCVRLIKSNPLPTIKDCFDFVEPDEMKVILKSNRGEVSRLIVSRPSLKEGWPRHFAMLGLLYILTETASEDGLKGGYSFIKSSLKNKLNILNFPYGVIPTYRQKYSKNVLKKYFTNKNDLVIPIFFILNDIQIFYDKLFSNNLFFKVHHERLIEVSYKSFFWNFFLLIRKIKSK